MVRSCLLFRGISSRLPRPVRSRLQRAMQVRIISIVQQSHSANGRSFSPFTWLGPKRYTDVPCPTEDIPTIDAVIISHNHYDHMDHPTIMKIKAKHPNVHFFVPLGNKKWFAESGINEGVTELDWWEQRDVDLAPSASKPAVSNTDVKSGSTEDKSISARIGCLPCQHTSARTPFDKGLTLWASWSVESGGKKVWFGGDTGYRAVPELPKGVDDYGEEHVYPHCPAFKDIGNLRGPFDLGLIPIGAYVRALASLFSSPEPRAASRVLFWVFLLRINASRLVFSFDREATLTLRYLFRIPAGLCRPCMQILLIASIFLRIQDASELWVYM